MPYEASLPLWIVMGRRKLEGGFRSRAHPFMPSQRASKLLGLGRKRLFFVSFDTVGFEYDDIEPVKNDPRTEILNRQRASRMESSTDHRIARASQTGGRTSLSSQAHDDPFVPTDAAMRCSMRRSERRCKPEI